MRYAYKTKDICAREIQFDINEGVVTNVRFEGGCDGNLKAIPILIDGWTADDIIKKCSGITCGRRPTSCSDQLAKAVKVASSQVSA
ncbi:MAG: TIGR03905 family TSCPD domain-containing protein [Desulfitobacterium sp.]|nr:TIGR03905 family TSCPD domain-containing protein [Desulfitobacterium sp.]